MFCYIIKPKEMTTEEMLSPKCIPCFRVKVGPPYLCVADVIKKIFLMNNACQVPYFEMSRKCFTIAIIALFSAYEQIHCALVLQDSE